MRAGPGWREGRPANPACAGHIGVGPGEGPQGQGVGDRGASGRYL